MRDEQDWGKAQWLGGEAQVYPHIGERKPASWTRLISGAMLLLAGMGIGRLAAIGGGTPGHARQEDGVGDRETCAPTERSETMERRRDEDRPTGSGAVDELGVVTILAAFGLGLMAGAVTALLTTPESGTAVRNRLKRGVDTARREFDETMGEVKQDWSTVGDEICDSVKRTASRVKQAAEVTKDALADGNDADASVRRVP